MVESKHLRTQSRRIFLKQGASLATLAPLALKLPGCGQEQAEDSGGVRKNSAVAKDGDELASSEALPTTDDKTLPSGAVLLGLVETDGEGAVTRALEKLDLSWLKAGQSVLIKVASNSGNPHPATTSPNGVRAMAKALKARGAGRVIVADQAGVEHVRRSQQGRFSNTRARFETNGLGSLSDVAELHFFDDSDWDSGYIEATLPDGHHWPRGLRLGAIVKEVDHIVYMPRISAHMLAGLTNAQKSAIGWLRDDSRHDLHNDATSFYEKYAEISYTQEIKSRFRMVVTLNEQVQLFGGPDSGTAYTMTPPLVLASTSLANHDAVATSVLVALQKHSGARPSGMTYTGTLASTLNGFFANGTGIGRGDAGAWVSDSPSSRFSAHPFDTSVDGERAVARGWELSGGKPQTIRLILDGEPMDDMLRTGLDEHGRGLYAWSRFG